MNNVTTTFLDEEMTKIKVVDLDHLYNFVVDDFSFNEMSVAAVSDIHAPGDLLMLEASLVCTSVNRTQQFFCSFVTAAFDLRLQIQITFGVFP